MSIPFNFRPLVVHVTSGVGFPTIGISVLIVDPDLTVILLLYILRRSASGGTVWNYRVRLRKDYCEILIEVSRVPCSSLVSTEQNASRASPTPASFLARTLTSYSRLSLKLSMV